MHSHFVGFVMRRLIFELVRSIAFSVFNWIFMQLADNMYRHKISDVFEFRPDQTIDFGVTLYTYLPFSAEKTHTRPCPEYSLLSFN